MPAPHPPGHYTIEHDPDGRLTLTTYPTTVGVSIDREWTNAGRPKKVNVRSGAPGYYRLADYRYDYTENGHDTNQLQKLEVRNSTNTVEYTATYDYNNRGQLVSENRTGGGGYDHTYTYDAAGNISSHTTVDQIDFVETTTRYGYDRAGQLCWQGPATGTSPVTTCPATAPGSNTVIPRDAAGNSQGQPGAPITYNARNQAATLDGQDQSYHDLGNDLRQSTGSTDLVNTAVGVTARTTSAGTTFYTRTPDGRLLGSRGADGEYYYVTDHQHSVLALIDADGFHAANYRYAPYGASDIIDEADPAAEAAAEANPFRWIGAYQDVPAGGYYHLGARYYDANGHFTQPDPLPGNMSEPLRTNAFAYAAGDPISNQDRSGRFWRSLLEWGWESYEAYDDGYDIGSVIYDSEDGDLSEITEDVIESGFFGLGIATTCTGAIALATGGVGLLGATACAAGGEVAGAWVSSQG